MALSESAWFRRQQLGNAALFTGVGSAEVAMRGLRPWIPAAVSGHSEVAASQRSLPPDDLLPALGRDQPGDD